MVKKEITFLGVEQKTPFGENVANTGEVEDEGNGIFGRGQEETRSNLDEAGLFPWGQRLNPIHSTWSRKKSHFLGLNERRHLMKM